MNRQSSTLCNFDSTERAQISFDTNILGFLIIFSLELEIVIFPSNHNSIIINIKTTQSIRFTKDSNPVDT